MKKCTGDSYVIEPLGLAAARLQYMCKCVSVVHVQVSVPCGDVNLLVVIYVSEYKFVQVSTSM